jgi:hypothetical protein
MAERGIGKKRSLSCYQNKVNKLTEWYEKLLLEREDNPNKINPNTKQEVKRNELKPLNYYIELIKKSKE